VLAEHVPQIPSLALGVWVSVGSRDEEPAEAGITHMIEHLVFKGSRRHTGYQLAKRMEAIGGQVDAFTTKENTCFYARVFAGHRRPAVEILSELLCEAAFEAEVVRREVAVVEEEIQGYEDSPEEQIHDLAAEVLFRGHPLGTPILGRRESLRRLSARRVRRYHRDRYTGSHVLVAAAGRVDFPRLLEEVERCFRLPPGEERLRDGRLPRFRRREQHVEKDVSQVSVCLVRRGPSYRDRNRHAQYLLNTILGAGASSRLFQAIREDEGLAYTVYSFLDSFRDTGVFGVYLGVSPERVHRALRLVCRELARLKRDGIRRWELESAKAQIFTGVFLSYESMYERIARLAHNQQYHGGQVPLEEVVRAIDGIDREAVQAAAEELLDPDAFSLVTLGPAGCPRPDLSALSF
jgi:predicted Zn-dependent peptidase